MRAVIFGAGSIGRGFIGQLMSRSGFDLILIDVNEKLINKLKRSKQYSLQLITNKEKQLEQIPVHTVICGTDNNMVAEAVSNADIMFTAVGAGALKYIAKPVAEGLSIRQKKGDQPLNIILCENMMDADDAFRNMVSVYCDNKDAITNTGFIRASVGRMVPIMETGVDILTVKAEPYYHLPIDADNIVGKIPEFLGLEPISPFDYAMERKLFIHNMGHAACAWIGAVKQYEYIYQVIEDNEIKDIVRKAMFEAAEGLSKKYNVSIKELENHIDDLMLRFGNKELKDTISRVGRDTYRKLGSNDRVIGALKLCREYNTPYKMLLDVISYGYAFINDDPGTKKVKDMLKKYGIRLTLKKLSGIMDAEIISIIEHRYKEISQQFLILR